MLASAVGKLDGKEFISHAPGYWSRDGGMPTELWNDWKWQLKNRVTSLAQLERHIDLCEEERSGVLLSGDKLALAITPHFFNLIPRENPDDPIRRQVRPTTWLIRAAKIRTCRCRVWCIVIRTVSSFS